MPSTTQVSEPAPIVTFYSYKGGVGRSMAVLNVASLIASRGFRVLIIDFDLEAPGLSHLIGKSALPAKTKASEKSETLHFKNGVVELLSDAVERGPKGDLYAKPFPKIAAKYTFSYKPPEKLEQHSGANLSIMPAGRLDESYSARLDELNLPELYRAPENPGKRLILDFREVLRNCGLYDYILVDSRTGHSDEAGICTRDLADHRMVVSGLNTQNISGTVAFLRNLHIALKQDNKPLKTPDIILSPVPNGEDDLVEKREKAASDEFQKAWGAKLKLNLLIPYHPRLALTEEAYFPTITASPLRSAYLDIERQLLRSLNHEPASLRQLFVERILEGAGPAALETLRRWIKLLHSPFLSDRQNYPLSPYLLLQRNGDLLKSLLLLPEALVILKLLAQSSRDFAPSGSMLFEIASQMHDLRVEPEKVAEFDSFLLSIDNFAAADLGKYAWVLANRFRCYDTSEAFYKRAISADSRHAINLGNYAVFIHYHQEENSDAAEAFYKRAIKADPKNANNLGNYANFLTDIRKDHDAAMAFYKRAIEADPAHAQILGTYAEFLTDIRKEHSAAEGFYKRAIAANPKHLRNLTNYAKFLRDVRKNLQGAREFYDRAVNADPTNVNRLGDYGQLLISIGQIAQGIDRLRAGWSNDNRGSLGNTAEMAFSLWLGTTLVDSEESVWERAFKYLIEKKFPRHPWNFDGMLAQVEKKLAPADFKYAKALAAAFLDESQVPALEDFPRWKKLQPLDPALVNPDGTIREAKKP